MSDWASQFCNSQTNHQLLVISLVLSILFINGEVQEVTLRSFLRLSFLRHPTSVFYMHLTVHLLSDLRLWTQNTHKDGPFLYLWVILGMKNSSGLSGWMHLAPTYTSCTTILSPPSGLTFSTSNLKIEMCSPHQARKRPWPRRRSCWSLSYRKWSIRLVILN